LIPHQNFKKIKKIIRYILFFRSFSNTAMVVVLEKRWLCSPTIRVYGLFVVESATRYMTVYLLYSGPRCTRSVDIVNVYSLGYI